MNTYTLKGHTISIKPIKSAYDRKAVLFANTITEALKQLGVHRDDISIETRIRGNSNEAAVVEFWTQGHYLRVSYALTKRFVDNLQVIKQVIQKEVDEVIKGEKTMHEFLETFTENSSRKEISKEVKTAKKTLGLSEDEDDMAIINKKYRELAQLYHPDAGGSMEEFQKINKAHKLIKKEMGG